MFVDLGLAALGLFVIVLLYKRGTRKFGDGEREFRRRHGVGNSILDREGQDYPSED